MLTIYRALLHLYPASFRGEYGEEMTAIFARRRRDTGWPGALMLLASALIEVPFNAAAVHWDILRQDLRYAMRTLARAPGFAITAILLVGLGVGANTAAFSVTDFVLLRPLPFREPDRLVKVWERLAGYSAIEASPANWRDWKRMTTVFESLAAFHPTAVNLVGQGEPERLEGSAVTYDLLPTLGVEPLMGRVFTAADDREGAPGTLVLSYRLWMAAFGGDAGVLGRTVKLDDEAYTVIGIMPREFRFPSREVDVWVPARFSEQHFEDRNDNWLEVVGRLKPGVSLEQASAEMDLVSAQLRQQYPKENENNFSTVYSLRDELSNESRLLLIALCGAALCVLLIACANLANLLLVRALARRQELAVRTAIGAGRERLVRQLATESLVLAALGGLIGVGVALAALPLLTRLVPATLPMAETPAIDLRVLLFAGALTAVTGLVFGMAPVLRAGRQIDLSWLRDGVRSGGGKRERLRAALVVAEIVASIVLLVSAGLLMRALVKLQGTDPGFRAENVLTLRTALPLPKYERVVRRQAFYTDVLSEVQRLPGVSTAAYISYLPMAMGGGIWPVIVDGQPDHRREAGRTASLRFVTPGFFSALSIPMRLGRDVSDGDTAIRPFVAVVSESFARRYWPDENPLGRRFTVAFNEREVVGVVGDIRVRGFERTSEPQIYLPAQQVEDNSIIGYIPKDLVIRSASDPTSLVPAIRTIVRNADPTQPISNVMTLAEIVDAETASRTVQLRVIGAFAVVAFLLAGIGIHGLLSFAVSQRSQEIGVRVALGAEPRDILVMIMRRGIVLTLAGIIPGAALAYLAGRGMESLLAGVTPADAPTFVTAIALSVVMATVGSLVPALRALRVDPIQAMRAE